MWLFWTILTLVILLAAIIMLSTSLKRENKRKDTYYPQDPIVFAQIYNYHKKSGYLRVCQSGNYKFSSSRLREIISKNPQELGNINIDSIQEAKTVPGVGSKVYALINHLVTKYKEENMAD